MLKTVLLGSAAAAILGLGGYVSGAFDCMLTCSPCSLKDKIMAQADLVVDDSPATTTGAAATGPAGTAQAAIAASAVSSTGSLSESEAATTEPMTYSVDLVHSSLLFRIKHANVAYVWGRFNDFSGTFKVDPENPSASMLEMEVRTNSVDTGNEGRDDHLRNPDFFNVRQFPVATFKSTNFEKVGEDKFKVTGDLTMHGVTKEVTADLNWIGTGSFRNTPKAGFEAKFEIKRSDFGIQTYIAPDGSDTGALGNTVDLVVAIEGNGQQ